MQAAEDRSNPSETGLSSNHRPAGRGNSARNAPAGDAQANSRNGKGQPQVTENKASDNGNGGAALGTIPECGQKAAVLLLDFQNEFCHRGGKLHEDVKDLMEKMEMLDKVPKFVEAARNSGAIIIHSPVAGDITHNYGSLEGLFKEGTWSCSFADEMSPSTGDIVLGNRQSYDAFEGTDLEKMLEENDVGVLFVAGFLTNICIQFSAITASDLELDVYVLSDGCAAKSEFEHTTAIQGPLSMVSTITTCEEAAALLQSKIQRRATGKEFKLKASAKMRNSSIMHLSTLYTQSVMSNFTGEKFVPQARPARQLLQERNIYLGGRKIPRDELDLLLSSTNFSGREISSFYAYFGFMSDQELLDSFHDEEERALNPGFNSRGIITRREFEALFADAGLQQPRLRLRLWYFFHPKTSSIDGINEREIVRALNPILRGTLEDIAGMFFDLYDVHGNGKLEAKNILCVYSDMVLRKQSDNAKDVILPSRRRRTTSLFERVGRHASQMYLSTTRTTIAGAAPSIQARELATEYGPPLSEDEKKSLTQWVEVQKRENNGVLDKETFIQGVLKASERPEFKSKSRFWTYRNIYAIALLFIFEIGPLLSLLALSALPDSFMETFNMTETGIGTLNAAYYVAATISPFVGAFIYDRIGPAGHHTTGASFATLGAFMQWGAAARASNGLLVVARCTIGFGMVMTYSASNEIYRALFPDRAGTMLGVHTLFYNGWYFLSFIILRALSSFGLRFALLMIALVGIVSTMANLGIAVLLWREKHSKNNEGKGNDEKKILQTFAAIATVVTPYEPRGCHKLKLPPSFLFVAWGIKAINYFFMQFSTFSVLYFSRNYNGISQNVAAVLTGAVLMGGGIIAPILGSMLDKYGRRSCYLSFASAVGALSYFILLSGNQGFIPYVFCALHSITAAFQDLCFQATSFVVLPSQIGVAYSVFFLFGGGIDTAISYMAGKLMASGQDYIFALYSASTMLLAVFGYMLLFVRERKQTFIERPLASVVETSGENLALGSLAAIIHSPHSCHDEVAGNNSQ